MKQLSNTNKRCDCNNIIWPILNSICFQMDDMTEKMFDETQQREWVMKEKAGIEERLKENDTLQTQLRETKELLQQEKLKV